MNNDHFDVILIGSGTSAYYCATGLLEAGKNIAIIDERPFGGTCALRGCQPKKYLVANAEAVSSAAHLVGKGIKSVPETDWSALQKLKNEFLEGLSDEAEESWKKKGVTIFKQHALLSGPQEVTLADGTILTAEYIVIATGSVSRPLNIQGSEHLHTSDNFLELPELPPRITFIGGGYISFEFAHVAARAGAEVTIMHRSAQVLKGFEPELTDVIVKASKSAGIQMVLEDSPTKIEQQDGGLKITTAAGNVFETDYVVAAAGRIPNLGVLDGGHGNVEFSSGGILVNEFLQSTSNPNVYAIGDCADAGLMLATVADDHGQISAKNICEGNKISYDYNLVPTSVFTIPSMGSVGLTEEKAKNAGLNFKINRGHTKEWPSSLRIGEEHGAYKILIDNESGLILGAHLVRHNAAEVINTFALAIAYKIPANALANFLWAYPTSTSDLKTMVK